MLVGYVSDERYVALPDALLEFEAGNRRVEVRSSASGAVHAGIEPGRYRVTIARDGYGSKRVDVTVAEGRPFQFRLLADGLLGYAWPRCVRSGEKSEFRVHSSEPYKLELFRYGREKEFVRAIGWFDEHGPRATVQITPDGDYTRTGVRWNSIGYTSPNHRQYVTAPERSGLYYFHASTRNAFTGADASVPQAFFSFPWIVAPARPRARIAVLVSDVNWNAYNNFGGRSNYANPAELPPVPTVNARQELPRYTDPDNVVYDREEYAPLSFERPEPINHIPLSVGLHDPIEGRAACHVAETEWRILGWLEQEGFDCDVYSETQLHHGVLTLDDYEVLLLGPHPEYWSGEMYYGVKGWVHERGGKLVYLGGNGLNCKVEITDQDTMKVFNGDAREIARRGLESRFHRYCESEANLLGVVYSDSGVMTAAPYEVIDAGHWIFAGTGLANGDLFGERSLHMRIPGGASGHETDKRSASSPAGVSVVARGLNPGGGGAEIVHYESGSGGEVFSAGSICYASSLLVDEVVSAITANALRRFLG